MCDSVDFDLKVAEFKINGYVLFEDMIPEQTVDRIRDAFMPLLENVRERETELSPVERGDVRTGLGKHQLPNRYTVTIPWVPPFADPAIYEHPVILEFLDRYWGSDKYEITCYHSNIPCPGTEVQHWHRDTTMGKDIPHLSLNVCPTIGLKFPLLDTSEENGSIEILPSTQYISESDFEGRYDDILSRGRFPSSHRLNMKKGSMWVQDVRTLHRGTPNRSDHPRPELVVCYCQSWYTIGNRVDLSTMDCSSLSDRGKRLFSRCLTEPH